MRLKEFNERVEGGEGKVAQREDELCAPPSILLQHSRR
jgi:hypothetical protein